MNKKHFIYIGVGIAVLLTMYFVFSCKDCGKHKFVAKLTTATHPETADVETDKSEL